MNNLPGNYQPYAKLPPRNYAPVDERIGQVDAFLAISSRPVTTHEIARATGLSVRRISQILGIMHDRHLIITEEFRAAHLAKGFKWLIRKAA
jgi:hypothetical protein